MYRLPLLTTLFAAALFAQVDPPPPAMPPAAPAVEVPVFPNPTCPIMGKKVSLPLFLDTELGRFYVCCKPCFKKILANLPAAYQTAYPTTKTVANRACPVSGEPIAEHAVQVTLQGHEFAVCCAGCVDEAKRNTQIVLTRLLRTDVVDVGNKTCPLTGQPVAANAFVLIDKSLVRLGSAKDVEVVAKDPAAVLAKAKAIAGKQPPALHTHTPKPTATPARQPENGK